jgi:hypothetical protein
MNDWVPKISPDHTGSNTHTGMTANHFKKLVNIFAKLFAQVEKIQDLFCYCRKACTSVFCTGKRSNFNLVYSRKIYRTLFLQRDTMFRDILFSRKTPLILQNLSFGWKIFRPFSHQHLQDFLHSFYSKFFSNLGNLHKMCLHAGKMKFLDR